MNIAELFVRVRGDTTDVTNKLRGAGQAVDDFGNRVNKASAAAEGHKLSLGKVERALASYIGHAAGANAVTEQLSVAFGSFALGGGVISGVLLGIGAVVGVYELLTKGERDAQEQSDKLTKSLDDQAAAAFQATKAGADLIELAAEYNRDQEKAKSGFGFKSAIVSLLTGRPTLDAADVEAQSKRIGNAEQAVGQAYSNSGKIAVDALEKRTRALKEAADAAERLRAKEEADLIKYHDLMARTYGDLSLLSGMTTAQRADFMRGQEWLSARTPAPSITFADLGLTTGPVDISDSVKIANDQAKKINDAAAKHTQEVRDAIWGSAIQLGNQIVSALNIGGGGRGSQLGGSIGSTIGFAAGFAGKIGFGLGGPVGGAIGALVGTIGGSLLGGLFDHHKKAVDANTNAVRQLTQAMLLNAPNVYKVAAARYDATEIKNFRNASTRYATRGGAPVMVVP